ncbi:MAG: response regulator, partial [Chitinophaga rupis]
MSGLPSNFHSLLVIDDHNVVVNGIKLLVGDQFSNFYQANDGAAGIELALKHQPQLVIIDYALRDISGDAVTKEIRYRCPATRILGY